MHARVVTYQIKPGQIDERIRHAREGRGAAMKQAPGLKSRVILVDPVSHKNMTIALFESKVDMDAVSNNEQNLPAFGRTEHAAGEATRESFEVSEQRGTTGKFARVRTYQVKPGQIDERLRHSRESGIPAGQQAPGWRGVLILVDRDSHQNVTIGFWDSEEEMLASERTEEFAHLQFAAGDTNTEHFTVGYSE